MMAWQVDFCGQPAISLGENDLRDELEVNYKEICIRNQVRWDSRLFIKTFIRFKMV